jgi:hypothetical protein
MISIAILILVASGMLVVLPKLLGTPPEGYRDASMSDPSAVTAGVELYGCALAFNAPSTRIRNTNAFPVLIRHVSRGFVGSDELTLSLKRIDPGAELLTGEVGPKDGFYVSVPGNNQDIGFFTGHCPTTAN